MQTVKDTAYAEMRSDLDRVDLLSRLIILLLPFVLFAINDNWIFDKPIAIDRWLYSGLHIHLPQFLKTFGETYYASRLPWTVIGWAAHSVFDDATALCILHFGLFYLAVFSLYVAVRIIFANTAAACAAALVLGTYTYFLAAVGWDYVDGPVVACMLAGIAVLASAAIRPRWRLAAFMWGVAMCSVVSMYILVLLLVPVQIGLFLFLNRVRANRPIVPIAAFAITGGAAAMTIFGLVNWLLGGPFLYILSQINVLGRVAQNRVLYDEPLTNWLWSAQHLFAAVIIFIFSSVFVVIHSKSVIEKIRLGAAGTDPEISLFICCLADVAASIIFAGLQADRFYVLRFYYNSDALLPFVYLTIGGAFAVMFTSSGFTRQLGFLVTAAVIALGPWLLGSFGYIFPKGYLFEGRDFTIAWVTAGSLLLVFLVRPARYLLGPATVVLFFSILSVGAPSGEIYFPPDAHFKADILSVFDASRAISRYNLDAGARFWYDENDDRGRIFDGVASTYFWGYRLVNNRFPSLFFANGKKSAVAPGQRIMLLTSKDEDVVTLANAAVADQHLLFEQRGKIDVRRSGVAFRIIVADVKGAIGPARSLPLATMRLVSQGALLQRDSAGMAFRSLPDPWTYIGRIPLFAGCIEGGGWVAADIDVRHGAASVGVLNRKGDDFLVSGSAAAGDRTQTIFLRLESFAAAGDLLLRNGDETASSEGTLQAVRIVADKGQAPVACDPDPARTKAMAQARSLPLEAMTLAHKGSWLQPSSSGVMFRSSPDPWAYVGRMPLLAGCLGGGGWIAADINVTQGTASVGVLYREGDDFLNSGTAVVASDKTQTVFLRVDSFAAAGDLVVRNWDERSSSEGILKAVRIAVDDGKMPMACDPDSARMRAMAQARALSFDTITLGSHGASLLPGASGIAFHSAPDPWSYIGRMPLLAGCIKSGGWVAADIRVTNGEVGLGVLNRKGDDFLVQRAGEITDGVQTIFLRLDSFAAAGDLILRNWDESSSSEGVLQAVRIAAESGQTPAACDSNAAATATPAKTYAHSAPELSGPTTNLPLGSLKAQNGGQLSAREGSVFLTTPTQRWAYAASAALAIPALAAGSGVVRVRLQVEQGKLGIGVLARDNVSHMLAEQAAEISDAPINVDVELADVANAGSLVFRSWSPNGESARARILSIETALRDGSQLQLLSESATILPLDSLQPQNGGELSTRDGSVFLATPAQQWAYAASAPLAIPERAAGPGVVHVRLQVEQGKLGIGVLARDNTSDMLAEQAAGITDAPIDVDVDVSDVVNAGSLVLRSWSPNGISVRARIFSIETLLQRAPQRARLKP
jgi:hypothetical protein